MLSASIVMGGCFVDRSGIAGTNAVDAATDASPRDADVGRDASFGDASWLDSGALDAEAGDAGPLDASKPDSGGFDAGAFDSGPSDGGAPDTGTLDSGPADSGTPDTGTPDSGPADSGMLDSGPPDSGPPSCDDIYGAASGYVFCGEPNPGECEFYTSHGPSESCRSLCAALSGRGNACVRRWRDEEGAGNECSHLDLSPRSCNALGNSSDICVCTR